MKLPGAILADGPAAARRLLDRSAAGAIEIPRPPAHALPYGDFVAAMLARQGFKLDFHGQAPDAVLAMIAERLLGAGAFGRERALLAEDIAAMVDFAGGLVADPEVAVSMRTYFAPGDLVWHLDRMNERAAFRLLWPIGRPAGMRVTAPDNIDEHLYRAYMRREHPLLCRLDTRVLRTGAGIEQLWPHRPRQMEAMISGRFPFIVDPDREWQVSPDAASVHRVQTPAQQGTYHRSSWANRQSPGLQIVITVSSDED